jgi:hypothetical protein
MHDGISFDKILPIWNKWIILGLENWKEFGHNARSATSRFSFAGSSLC